MDKKSQAYNTLKEHIGNAVNRPDSIYSQPGQVCTESYVQTIEEKLYRMELKGKSLIEQGQAELNTVTKIREMLKKNPSLSDLYSLLKF